MRFKRTMRHFLGWILAAIIIILGATRRAKHKSFKDGVVLSVHFHDPNKKLFRKMVVWLKRNGYTFISTEQLIAILNKKMSCPQGATWLSFDDGWKKNITNVLPSARVYSIPVTIFICTSAVESGTFWWTKALKYSYLLPRKYQDINTLMKLPEDSRKRALKQLEKVEMPDSLGEEAMTVEDVKRIAAIPQVTIGSHTINHPLFKNCTDIQIDTELKESKKKLEGWIEKPVKAFAYPDGSFTGREEALLKKHGYELAATTLNRFIKITDNPYQLPRTIVMNDGSFIENLCHALGVWEPVINNLKHISRIRRK